ncbi:Lrp/AsnC ligand binding domain-containing protein [Paraburkholderia sediminicola]|uniref:Lrp/AsnC ligand binding domain-containing protein n=1 Tax=Paraburkholderia sediminicola TaxID=458836 RepID=UPI0038B9EEF8
MKKIDQIDLAILAELQRDARLTTAALAREIGLSATPVSERVKSLEAAGVISGYTTRFAPSKLGLGLLVFIEIAIDRTSEDAFAEFKEAVLKIPEVQECHMVAGGFDYLLKVRVADMDAYRAFLSTALGKVKNIKQTHSYAVMEEVKDSFAIDLARVPIESGVR